MSAVQSNTMPNASSVDSPVEEVTQRTHIEFKSWVIPVWILFGVCTQRNLDIPFTVNMLNINIPVSDDCILFMKPPVMF